MVWKMNANDLLERAVSGDREAFETLLRPHREGILNLAYRMSGNREDALEIGQEVILKVFKYLGRFRRDMNMKNWLYSITVNAARDHLRRRQSSFRVLDRPLDTGAGDDAANPETRYLNREIRSKIRECLEVLTPKEKSVFLLRDGEGYSIAETAAVLGFSSASVRTHLSRARKKIRDRFVRIYPMSGRGQSDEVS